jgi:hypothetical protein
MTTSPRALAALLAIPIFVACAASTATTTTAAGTDAAVGGDGAVTLYSGRTEELVSPLIERFEQVPESTSKCVTAALRRWLRPC